MDAAAGTFVVTPSSVGDHADRLLVPVGVEVTAEQEVLIARLLLHLVGDVHRGVRLVDPVAVAVAGSAYRGVVTG
jgi:hypothetical protein